MSIKRGTLVMIKKSEALRGQYGLVESTKRTQFLGLVLGFHNYRNPYAGLGKAESHLFLAQVVLLPPELQPQAAVWATAPQPILDSIFSGKPVPVRLGNLAERETGKNFGDVTGD